MWLAVTAAGFREAERAQVLGLEARLKAGTHGGQFQD